MYCPDLGRECQIAADDRVRAVGWLSSQFPFPKGAVSAELIPALRVLIRRGWVPFVAAGSHACELCIEQPHRENANVLVPTEQVLYVAPAMVVHYIEAHSYRPPDEFVRAVLECSAPGTMAYEAQLRPFLNCWSEFVPREELETALREHCDEQADVGKHFAAADGPGAFDPPWYVSVVEGVEGSPIPIAKVLAARWRVSYATALARLRAGDTVLEFHDSTDAERWVASLRAAGATLQVWNRGQSR